MTVKQVCYAYPSSTMAKRLKRSNDGCYYIAIKRASTDADAIETHGPFETLSEAQARACAMPYQWCRFTMRAQGTEQP